MFRDPRDRVCREPVSIIIGAIAGTGTAAAGIVAGAVLQVAAFAYTAYSTFTAYRQGKKAEAAARRAELEARERNARRNFRSPVTAKRIVYGRERLGGPILYADNPNKEDAVLVIGLADHEIEEVEQILITDEDINPDPATGESQGKYAGHLWAWAHLGAPGQDLSSDLIALGCTNITANDKFEGTACLIIRTRNLLRDFPDAEANFNAVFKGKKDIFDPRDDSTGYTDNAALCAADYAEKFMDFSRTQINESELIASADVCDEEVFRKNGLPEKRYTINGVISSDQEHRQVLPDLALAMAGNIAWVGGEWLFVAGRHRAPEATFTADDILGDFEYSYRGSARDIPNIGKGTFKSPAHNWQSISIPEFVDSARLAEAGGERRELDLTLPFTNSGTMAQRILKIATRRAQQEEGCTLQMKPSALQVKTTDTAIFDIPRHGIDGKTFEVRDFATSITAEDNQINFRCSVQIQSYEASIFDYDAATEEQDIPTATARLGEVSPNVPTEIALTDNGPDYTLEWEDPSPNGKEVARTEIEVCHDSPAIPDDPGTPEDESVPSVETCDEYTVEGAGIETFDFAIPATHTLSTVRLRSLFDDNTTSQWVAP